jgi:adhesin/invasin
MRRSAHALFACCISLALLTACKDSDSATTSPKDTPSRAVVIAGHDTWLAAGGTLDSVAIVVFGTAGEPLANTSVSWAVSDGTLSATTSTTDDQGIARVIYTSGTKAGAVTFTATIPGIDALTFGATITPSSPAQLVALSAVHDTVTAGEAFNFAAVRVEDQFGNPVPNVTLVALLQNASSDDMLTSPSLTTNSDGVIFEQFNAGLSAGTRTLSFATTDGSLSLSYTIDVMAPPVTATSSVRSGGL